MASSIDNLERQRLALQHQLDERKTAVERNTCPREARNAR